VLRPVLGDRLLLFTELPRRGLFGNPELSEQKKRAGLGALAFFHLYSSAPIKPDVISL
jgi:hypothetical protein